MLHYISRTAVKIIFISIILFACKNESSTRDNKFKENPELKKALDHYKSPADSLKRKALLFLIDNMEYKWGLKQVVAESFIPLQRHLFNTPKDSLSRKMKDSITLWCSQKMVPDSYVPDLQEIHAELLIENIDYAFKIWELPWTKHLSFSTFCEYVLPYRVQDEPLSHWRKELFEFYKPLMDSLKESGVADPVKVAKVISDHVAKRYSFHDIVIPNIALETGNQIPAGECLQRYILLTSIGRCFGLPMALDFVQQFAHWPGSHYWTVLVDDGHGKILAFNGGEKKWEVNPFKGPKMYRKTFKNHVREADISVQFFKNPNNLDVTDQYPYTVKDLTITFKETVENQEVYLFAFGIGPELIPIDRGVIEDTTARFKNLSFADYTIVMPGIMQEGKIHLLTNPVVVWTDGSKTIFQPEKETLRKVKCTSKYPVTWPMSEFAEKIKGAKIQGANRPDFADSVTILSLDVPWFFKHYKITAKEFAYYRYLPRPSTSINLAELQFYFKSKRDTLCKEQKNTLFSPSISEPDLQNVSDWDIRTNLNTSPDKWFAVNVRNKEAKCLCEIAILTRNDYNVIEKGHRYELFYFDKDWISVEQKVAHDFSLEFENVPKGCLMILRDLTEGRQERIFEYKDNQQIFW